MIDNPLRALADLGSTRFLAKQLAPNDNSKNQIYIGGSFDVLHKIPHGPLATDSSATANSQRERTKASIDFHWLTEEGPKPAPSAQLILYPRYPEVRISGLLKGARNAPNDLVASRQPGRVLLLGISPGGTVFAFICDSSHPFARQLEDLESDDDGPPLFDVSSLVDANGRNTEERLLQELGRIHSSGWIDGQKLDQTGASKPYQAPNGGGYTLEAELGVLPNSKSEPDYLGWEVKQFGVKSIVDGRPKNPVTLMTPEPDGGLYTSEGFEAFIRKFGYADKLGRPDRLNFGGVYRVGATAHPDTTLQLAVTGFDPASGSVIDFGGGSICLVNPSGTVAASWSFEKLLDAWRSKHAQAVYVPCERHKEQNAFRFGATVKLGIGTSFSKYLSAVASGHLYLDPGMKFISTTGEKKRRSQFRVRHPDLPSLYHSWQVRSVVEIPLGGAVD